ncbi:MAG: solute:sodium symporter family transporter [Planctomycetota bacterium]|nr:MAG: solute:sodium symporter family transporter [Planctomycetota bacterium]
MTPLLATLSLTGLDALVFLLFLAAVVGISLYVSRRERSTEDYFLAGRKLTWWLIGVSLIASNISTEHFVGMAGSAFGRVGLAIASYEWMAAVTLVFVAWWFLPRFLRAGIYTMPEFLEYRYDGGTRAIMAAFLMVAYVIVLLATVLYSGAMALNGIFELPRVFHEQFGLSLAAEAPWRESAEFWATLCGIWMVGIIAAACTVYGGLTAVVWSDLLQGGALLLGGGVVAFLALKEIGDGSLTQGWRDFVDFNQDKLHTVLPWNDPDIPWVAVFIGGLWIPNLFYWGLNQFITQRTLGAKSLAEGQKGIFLAALIKLIIPFIIVMPGIMAFQLYGQEISALGGHAGDKAYPYMIARLLPASLRGIMFAALCGAVMSTFNSGLNSASTIFTMDLYKRYWRPESSPQEDVKTGRWATAVLAILACLWAPVISSFEGVFAYIQEIWGFISPGILAVFVVGLLVPKTPPAAAKVALLAGIPLYGFCRFGDAWIQADWMRSFHQLAFLHHMLLVFLVLVAMLLIWTWRAPLQKAKPLPVSQLNLEPHPRARLYGCSIIVLTAGLYALFW